jgi:hypothetical protein
LVTEYEFEYRAVPGRDAYDHQTSFVVTQGEEVKGALLIVRPEHHVAQIDVRVVDTVEPELRFGANALLLHEGLRRARLQGIDLLRFRGHDVDHRETANLAKRIGARQLGRQLALARGCRG